MVDFWDITPYSIGNIPESCYLYTRRRKDLKFAQIFRFNFH
jgi:hypothetical protein